MTSWVLWALYYQRKHSTAHQIMERVAETWKSQYAKEAIPLTAKAAIAARELSISEERFEGKGTGGQKWKVFHCALPESAKKGGDKVVIYWHGGAFINGVSHHTPMWIMTDESRQHLNIGQHHNE